MIFLVGYLVALLAGAAHILLKGATLDAAARVRVLILYQLAASGVLLTLAFVGHGLQPEVTAARIGWPPHPQFQLELGAFELGTAVAAFLGLVIRDRRYWLGVFVPSFVMMPVAAWLHWRELVSKGNLAAYNVVTIGADLVGPALMLALLVATFRLSKGRE